MDIEYESFSWNEAKETKNILTHGVSFTKASEAFFDPHRVILTDEAHSRDEERYFCLGAVSGRIVTVRFIHRHGKIRIFGAGHWRKGRKIYETQNKK